MSGPPGLWTMYCVYSVIMTDNGSGNYEVRWTVTWLICSILRYCCLELYSFCFDKKKRAGAWNVVFFLFVFETPCRLDWRSHVSSYVTTWPLPPRIPSCHAYGPLGQLVTSLIHVSDEKNIHSKYKHLPLSLHIFSKMRTFISITIFSIWKICLPQFWRYVLFENVSFMEFDQYIRHSCNIYEPWQYKQIGLQT